MRIKPSFSGDDCQVRVEGPVDVAGTTADGRPFYETYVTEKLTGIGTTKVWLFYDSDCGGQGSKPNRWFTSTNKPSQSRTSNLLENDLCVSSLTDSKGGMYTKDENYDWFPPSMQDGWMRVCFVAPVLGAFFERNWKTQTLRIEITDSSCPLYNARQPYTYVYTPWQRIITRTGNSKVACCERSRIEEPCLTHPECPCKNRLDPSTTIELSYDLIKCPTKTTTPLRTTTSTTSTTTTTTAREINSTTTTTTTTTTMATTTTSTTTSLLPSTSTLLVVVEDTLVVGDAKAGSSVAMTSTMSPAASAHPMPLDISDAVTVQVNSTQQNNPGLGDQGQQQQQPPQQQVGEGMSGTTIALVVMGVLALVGIGAALHMRAANQRQKEDAAAVAAAYHGNQRGEVVDDFEPDPNQHDVHAKNKAKMQEYAEASALVVQKTTAELDSDGYVVDDFNPSDLGRHASINVVTRQAIYAIPVAEDERVAVIANTTYGQPNAGVPSGPALRSNKKKQGSVYLGFDQVNEESML